ncbi:hypothetical protein B7463_g4313, partial [Scytalidium lignicola]
MFDIDWIGLSVPFAYIAVLLGALITFSSLYRKRKAAKSATLAPWFPPHLQRNIYLSLLHLNPEEGKEKPPAVPESVLRAALLRRAVEDIHRIIQVRTAKQACSTLLQRGSVGDDLWQRFLRAEKEMEQELTDVVMEANGLAPNWGQTIFQSANEIAANTVFRKRLDEIQAQTEAEKEWWEKRRASIQAEFMKELDTSPTASGKSPANKVGSDEDAILVEAGGPTVSDKGSIRKKAKMQFKKRRSQNPHFAPKIAQLGYRLAPLVRVTTGTVHPSFPATVLNYHLLTDSELDDLAEFYHQKTRSRYTSQYPCPVEWRPDLTLADKRRKFGRFIGLRGCDTPIRTKTEEEIMEEARMARLRDDRERKGRKYARY